MSSTLSVLDDHSALFQLLSLRSVYLWRYTSSEKTREFFLQEKRQGQSIPYRLSALYKNQFCLYDFSCPCLYFVHFSNPQNRVFCFKLFSPPSLSAICSTNRNIISALLYLRIIFRGTAINGTFPIVSIFQSIFPTKR